MSPSGLARRVHRFGVVYVQCSWNNTIATLTDGKGLTLHGVSCGTLGFRHARKATRFAAHRVGEVLAKRAAKLGFAALRVVVSGVGHHKQTVVRGLATGRRITITRVLDRTPVPHNGCRRPRARRT